MKTTKFLSITVVLLAVLLAGVLIGGGAYLQKQSERTTYFGKTLINGRDVSDETPEEVKEDIMRTCRTRTVVINEKGEESITGNLSEFGYEVDEKTLSRALETALERQKSGFTVLISSLMNGNAFRIEIPYTYDEKTFSEIVNSGHLKEKRFPSVDSEMVYDEKKKEYSITEEVYGNELPDKKLQDLVKTELDSFIKEDISVVLAEIDIPEEFYIPPEVTHDDIELNNIVNIYNRYVKADITWLFGSYKEHIDWNTIKDWVVIDENGGSISDVLAYEFVERLGEKYNTLHYDRPFHTSIGTDIIIPSSENDYGYLIFQDGEYSQLKADIEANTTIEREPVYYTTASDYGNPVYYTRDGKDDLAGNYVEVNLSIQHLWFYRDGGLVIDTDVVTGCVSRNSETKTGAFPVAYKESPSVLRGQDAANGYETKVNYWMPFYDGQGLHDASWRSAFGGNIYIYNGSHGCVNIPPYAAEVIYNNIEEGMAVIIYK